jgi:hypothetical protein
MHVHADLVRSLNTRQRRVVEARVFSRLPHLSRHGAERIRFNQFNLVHIPFVESGDRGEKIDNDAVRERLDVRREGGKESFAIFEHIDAIYKQTRVGNTIYHEVVHIEASHVDMASFFSIQGLEDDMGLPDTAFEC